MSVVDAYLLYEGNREVQGYMPPTMFFATLADEFVDNTYRATHGHSQGLAPEPYFFDSTESGSLPHLTTTNRKWKLADGTATKLYH